MFKQFQELKEVDDKQSSRAQFGAFSCGIRVRDPSQMFVFGDTNWVRGVSNRLGDTNECSGLLTKNKSQPSGSVDGNLCNKEDGKRMGAEGFKNLFAKTENVDGFRSITSHESAGGLAKSKGQQAVIFGGSSIGKQCSGSVDHNLCNKEDDKRMGTEGFKNMFAKTENSDGFHGLLTKNKSQQAVIFGKSLIGDQCSGSVDDNLCNKEDGKNLGTKSFKTMFAKTENSDGFHSVPSREASGLLTGNRSQQAVIFGKSLVGEQCSGSVRNKEDGKNLGTKDFKNMFAKTENCDGSQSIRTGSWSVAMQSAVAEASSSDANPSRSSQKMVDFSKPFKSPKSENVQLSDHNQMTWHIVSVKNEDGQIWSISPTSTSLDAAVQKNPFVTGSCELPSTSYAANNKIRKPRLQQIDVANQNTRSLNSNKRKVTANQNAHSLNSKNRKLSIFDRLPWHKEETEGSLRLHDISPAELAWARAVARRPEKLKQLSEDTTGPRLIINRKIRLSFTTKLMQLLFHPPPANVLTEDAVTHCDAVTYYASKLALGDEFRLYSLARKNMASKSSSEHDLLKAIEGFIGRSKRLEDDVKRLEKKGSLIHDIRMVSQHLEKLSSTSRLAKFHAARPMVTGDTQSSTMRKPNPQKYVKAYPMPKTVPEVQNCLFL